MLKIHIFRLFRRLCNAMRVHVHICLLAPPLSCERVRSRRGSRLCVRGVICFYGGWQLITNPDKHRGRAEGGEREWGRGGKREGERVGGGKRREIAPGGQGDWHLNSTGEPQSALDPDAWLWSGGPDRRPLGPLTTNRPPSVEVHAEMARRQGKKKKTVFFFFFPFFFWWVA